MARTCCLAGVAPAAIPLLTAVFQAAGIANPPTIAACNVSELGRLRPDLLVCDLDALDVDPLELLRQVRFVLPDCMIAVYSDRTQNKWSLSCHLAGANCMLSKLSAGGALSKGILEALESGCYTDPRFVA